MKIKVNCIYTGEGLVISPVFFSWNVGLQFKCVEGWKSGSMFCDRETAFVWDKRAKIQLFFIKIAYWIVKYLYMHLFHYWPTRLVKAYIRLIDPQRNDELPF